MGIAVLAVLFLLWYFSSIVAYILIAAVLGVIGKPIVDWLSRIKIKKWVMPRWLSALLALAVMYALFFTLMRLVVPLIVGQFRTLEAVNVVALVDSYSSQIASIEQWMHTYLPASMEGFSLRGYLTEQISGILSVAMLSNIFNSTANILVNIAIALLSITFITFFFLKDENLFYAGILILVPTKWEKQVSHALSSIGRLLRRYFIGIFAEGVCIAILNTIWFSIVGLKFETAVVIAFIAGIFPIVPYVGALVSMVFGVLITIATAYGTALQPDLPYLVMGVIGSMSLTLLIDNFALQPFIYGNSVKAHPLEIFIVILVAGNVAGILGMMLAIPSYTVLRVFAKEFFYNFKVVKKLTEKI